ncbi:hypothetical protein EJB05_24331 [Eragrostis curvula]|uniref:Knottin scorpion toxin-like domain-containing protein n=1 Tax=Eragrostis curvula TaxID=38414 RepID=A0A5J9VAR4_9POAL|nr:hypothetical protein EJB05_24331 [Eragrostis curvula]
MRNSQGVLLLAVVALVVILSSGICTATTAGVAFPPEYTCDKIISHGKCNSKACHNSCFSRYKGDGLCNRAGCQCTYMCKPPPGGDKGKPGPTPKMV